MFGKIFLLSIVTVGTMMLTVSYMHAESSTVPAVAIAQKEMPLPPTISSHAWGIFSPETGVVLTGDNTNVSLPIASVSKLFTATVVMESAKKSDSMTILSSDVRTEGRSGKLVAGTKTTPYDLLFPLLIESSNDAGVAIARTLGKEFNTEIQEVVTTLSLINTHIVEPTGLSSKNISTVSDLSIFYAYVKRVHPHILDITELYTYIDNRTGYGNSNPARTLSSFTGGKQGYTDEAGRTFVGTFVLDDGVTEIGIVLLKSEHLLADIKAVLSYANSIAHNSDILKS